MKTVCLASAARRARAGLATGIASALLLAGCASMAPPYQAPALPVAPRFEMPSEAQGADPATLGWRGYFTEPRLQALIEAALQHNRDLRTAALRVTEAHAAYGLQRSQEFPSLAAQAGMDRARLPADLSPLRRPTLSSQYQAGLGLASWELDFWGRLRSLRDAALETELATEAARRAVALGLITQVADTYLALRELDERLALARRTTESRQETLRIFSRRVDVGSASRLTLTQMQVLLNQAQALTAQLEQARAAHVHALVLLVGAPVEWAPAREAPDDRPALPALRVGLPSELLQRRPDILAAEHQLKAAHADIGAARAAFFPRVALTGSLGRASADLDGLFAGGSRAWTFAPRISLPIFDAGRNRSNLDLADARRHLAVAHYEKVVQSAFRDVSDALSNAQWLQQQHRIAEEAVAAQAERARLSRLRHDSGAAAFLEVLDAQRELLAAQQQLVQARHALLSNQVSLYAALGGGALEDDLSAPATANPNPQAP